MQSLQTIHVTVTTAPGQPTIDLEGDLSNREIACIVKHRFGQQAPPGAALALPHSFCAVIDPPPAARSACNNRRLNVFDPRGSRRWAC